jgi:oxygen-independent coproporphyrinogen-3 oxidase
LSLPAGLPDAPAADPSGTILRRWKHRHPAAWMAHAGGAGAIGGDEAIGADRRAFDFMLNALRLVDGFALDLFEARTGMPRSAIGAELATALDRGWIQVRDGHVVPTELGRRFTNDVVGLFLGD